MALQGKRVLLIDTDMQMNLSLSLFSEEEVLEFATSERNLYHAVKGQKELGSYIVPTAYENLDLIPSSTLMSSIEYELFTKWQREYLSLIHISLISAPGNPWQAVSLWPTAALQQGMGAFQGEAQERWPFALGGSW